MTPATGFDLLERPLHGVQLIEASAGTGKTWTLTGLVLRLLLEQGLDISQVLVVTFTNAATAELRDRIRGRLADARAVARGAAGNADGFAAALLHRLARSHGLDAATAARRLDRALQHFDDASIHTIHGFCQRALAELPFTAGAPLARTLVPDDRDLRAEVVRDHWRRAVAGAPLPPLLARALSDGFTPDVLDDALRRHLARPLAQLRWSDGVDAPPPMDGAPLQQAYDAASRCWDRHGADAIGEALTTPPGVLNAQVYSSRAIDEAVAAWDAWVRAGDPLHPLARPVADRLPLLGAASIAARLRKAKPKGPPIVAPTHPFFPLADAALDARQRTLHAVALHRQHLIWQLLRNGPRELAALKASRRVLGFDDLLGELHRRLAGGEHPGLAAALRRRWPAALVDEFQDTDPQQWAIFRTVWHGDATVPDAPDGASDPGDATAAGHGSHRTLILVGDPKQAIYGFRNADLPTYLAARSAADATATLDVNQRSVQPLLDGLNALFGSHDRPFLVDDIGYARVVAGTRPRPALTDPPAHASEPPRAALSLWALPGLLDADDASLLPREAAGRAACAAMAAEIARMLAGGLRGTVRLGERPLGAGDIAVLVRSHRQASIARAALTAAGIASVTASPQSVFASPEARDLQRVLRAVREPTHEPLLRAALATEAMGWTADRIAALDDDEAALVGLIDRFAQAQAVWQSDGVGPLLRRFLDTESVAARLLAHADGERRLANWLHLTDLLQAAAAEHPAPDALLQWLAARLADPPLGDESTQLRLESDRHLVQIVTVHRSKGLEYPVVFCPFAWAAPTPPKTTVPWQGTLAGQAVIDFRDPVPADDAAVRLDATRREHLAEELRLLYVALTRAVVRCVVVVGAAASRQSSSRADRHSPLHWLVAGHRAADWAAWSTARPGLGLADLREAWRDLAHRAGPTAVSLAPLPDATAPPLPPDGVDLDRLAALPPPARIPAAWQLGSYSLLAHGAGREAAADHDAGAAGSGGTTGAAAPRAAGSAVDPDGPESVASLDADDILGFPRGAAPGECLHAVYETVDFTDAAGWPAAIEAAIARFPLPAVADPSHHDPAAALHRLLRESLTVPLTLAGAARPLRLAEVGWPRRVAEMAFHLPVGRLTAPALAALLRRHGVPLPPGGFAPLEGYLRGFVDAVVEHEGRFHVVDWKSNHLGLRPADYDQPRLEAEMRAHAYHLQALIYAVALHRLLRLRLPGYDPDRHLGDVLYLFVRGLRPGWHRADGTPCGVYAWRPSRELLAEFEALVDAPADDRRPQPDGCLPEVAA